MPLSFRPGFHPEFDVHRGAEAPHVGNSSGSSKTITAQLTPQDLDSFTVPALALRPLTKAAHHPQTYTFPNDKKTYHVMDSLSTPDSLQLGIRNPKTGALRQVRKTMSRDGRGGWKRDKGLAGGGQHNTKHGPESVPLLGSSGGRSNSASSDHSFSNRSGWGNASTASPGAVAGASASGSPSGWSNPSTGSPGAATSAASSAPPIPPRNMQAGAAQPRSEFDFGPVPDQRYLTHSGDKGSKYWVISDGRGGYKPADSSIDRYGQGIHVFLGGPNTGKSVWRGPDASVSPPR